MIADNDEIATSDSLPLTIGQHPDFKDVQQPVTSFYNQGPSHRQPVNHVPLFNADPAVYNHQHEVYLAHQQQQHHQMQQLREEAVPESVVYRKRGYLYVIAIILAIIATVVALPFGLVALVMAVLAFRASSDSNRQSAARAFVGFSLAVSVVAVLAVVIAALLFALAWKPWISLLTSQCNAAEPAANTTSPTTTTAETQCPYYLNGACYPYGIHWSEGPSGCRAGTLSADGSLCYYDRWYSTTSGQQQPCRGDSNTRNDCYYTSDALCSGTRMYHNGICYPYFLRQPIRNGASCQHGFPEISQDSDNEVICYYDAVYLDTDHTCDGWKAELSDSGWCFYSSSNACRYATNFVNGTCRPYALFATSSADCPSGFFVDGVCFYDNADRVGSGVFSCLAPAREHLGDHIGDYCYYSAADKVTKMQQSCKCG